MRILVLGGAGIMARVAVAELCQAGDVSEVILADMREKKAKQIAAELGQGKASGQFLDVNDTAHMVEMMKTADIVVNAVGPFYRYGVPIVRAAIEARVNYVDICDDYDPTRQILELDKAAKDAGITILIGMGESPGTANVLARYGADKLDRVDEIHMYWTSSWIDPVGFGCLFHMMHGLKGNTPQYLDGRWVNVPAGAGKETVDFPEPVGKVDCYFIGHPEPVTLPLYIKKGIKYATNRGGMVPSWGMDYFFDLIEYGYAGEEPVNVKGVSVVPVDVAAVMLAKWSAATARDLGQAYTALRVDVKGEKAGNRAVYSFVEDSVHHGMNKATGTPLAIGAQMLYRGEIKGKGVFPPEAVVNPKKFLAELAKRDITFSETETVTAATV